MKASLLRALPFSRSRGKTGLEQEVGEQREAANQEAEHKSCYLQQATVVAEKEVQGPNILSSYVLRPTPEPSSRATPEPRTEALTQELRTKHLKQQEQISRLGEFVTFGYGQGLRKQGSDKFTHRPLQFPAYTQVVWITFACWGVNFLPPAFA